MITYFEIDLPEIKLKRCQQTTTIAETAIAETTTIEDKLSGKTTVLEEIELGLFTGFEDTTALEDKKSLAVFSAIAVVCCTKGRRNAKKKSKVKFPLG